MLECILSDDCMVGSNKFVQLWLIVGIVTGFAVMLFFGITYLNDSVLCDVDCRVRNEVSLSLVLVSLFGMFVGSLTYYFISEKYEKKIVKIRKDASATYKFLDSEQRKILKCLVDANGRITQSELCRSTGLSRVRVSRCLAVFESKRIVEKTKNGMTNEIRLSDDLAELFLRKYE